MQPDLRAVVFDLDDTLYAYRRFRLSGFSVAARELERRTGLDRRLGFRAMHRATRGVTRGREIQACLTQYELPLALADDLVDLVRHHVPQLRLPRASVRLLGTLREEGWRTAILTNGTPSIQRRKVAALGIEPLVDAVVYAAEVGSGAGKPDPDVFAFVADRLGVAAARTVMVGNDEDADIGGALLAGMHAVRADVWHRQPPTSRARAIVARLTDIPVVLRHFALEDPRRHAA